MFVVAILFIVVGLSNGQGIILQKKRNQYLLGAGSFNPCSSEYTLVQDNLNHQHSLVYNSNASEYFIAYIQQVIFFLLKVKYL